MNDLSRGALVEDIIYTIALTAIQARGRRRMSRTDPVSARETAPAPPGSPAPLAAPPSRMAQ